MLKKAKNFGRSTFDMTNHSHANEVFGQKGNVHARDELHS